MAGVNELVIGGETFSLIADSLLPKGKRAMERNLIATNVAPATIPGLEHVRLASWNVWGPIGASRQSSSNVLGTDYAQNLETRWPRRLISAAELNTVNIDLPEHATGSGLVGAFLVGDTETKVCGTAGSGLDPDGTSAVVRWFDQQNDSIFAHSANISSQVDNIASDGWTASGFHVQGDTVRGAAQWYGEGRIGLGNGDLAQSRTAVVPGGSFYAPIYADTPPDVDAGTNGVKLGAMAVGSDRLWAVDEIHANSNRVTYTLDSCENFGASFQVGDAHIPAQGIGPFGPKTHFGTETNLYSFTDQAKPVPLSRALIGHRSKENGLQWADPGWGWDYAITNIGLRAISGTEDNPVGIGERMREFTGHNGIPTAIWAERGELWVAYETTAGDTYVYRCVFSRIPRTSDEQGLNFGQGVYGSQTSLNGHPDLYPAHFFEGVACHAIGSTNSPPDTEVMFGHVSGTFLRQVIDREGREDIKPGYRYGLLGGTWFGTMLDSGPNLMKSLRCVRIRVRNVNPCASWQVWVSFNYDERNNVDDSNVIWQQVGPTLTEDGYYTLYPVSGVPPLMAAPIDNIWGRTIKIKLVQTVEPDAINYLPNPIFYPPEVDGQVEVEYFERPEFMEKITFAIQCEAQQRTSNKTFEVLERLQSDSTTAPLRCYIPDRLPNVPVYGFVNSVEHRRDSNNPDMELAEVTLYVWGPVDGEAIQ